MRRGTDPALKQVVRDIERAPFQHRSHGRARLLGDLELHGPASLLLDDDGTVLDLAAGGDVIYAQPDQVAGAQLAVDGQIEEREVAASMLELQAGSDGPYLLRLQCRLLAGEFTGGHTRRRRARRDR